MKENTEIEKRNVEGGGGTKVVSEVHEQIRSEKKIRCTGPCSSSRSVALTFIQIASNLFMSMSHKRVKFPMTIPESLTNLISCHGNVEVSLKFRCCDCDCMRLELSLVRYEPDCNEDSIYI